MTIEHINPPTLPEAQGYVHVVKASGGTTVYIAGQGAYGVDGTLVGPGNHYLQFKQAFSNLRKALAAAGADTQHVVKATFYVVNSTEAVLGEFIRGMTEAFDGQYLLTAATFVGVERLAFDEMLVEVDAIAVID
ncbi:MAG: RidA family protein [Deltaproteobacteria bacterium]|nr:RidA family protein [Deltaproteobacteria bacterium]